LSPGGNVRLAWRKAFEPTVYYPVVAPGFLGFTLLMRWLVIISKGALIVVVPALWVSIAIHTTADIVRSPDELPWLTG
jgi:hypothetical protein